MPEARTVQRAVDAATSELARQVKAKMMGLYPERWQRLPEWLNAFNLWDRSRFWEDEGHWSVEEWGRASFPHQPPGRWTGWSVLARLPRHPSLLRLVVSDRRLPVEKLAPLDTIITPFNWRPWITLALHFSKRHLRMAVQEYRRMADQGLEGDLVFVPLWVPRARYEEIFKDENCAWKALESYTRRHRSRQAS